MKRLALLLYSFLFVFSSHGQGLMAQPMSEVVSDTIQEAIQSPPITAPGTGTPKKVFATSKRLSLGERIKLKFANLIKSPHMDKVARVRVGANISPKELELYKKRSNKVKAAISKKFAQPLPRLPKVAIVASGGGMRAALVTLGALSGFQETGIFDATLWLSTLSGSTWALASWLQKKIDNPKLTIQDHAREFIDMIKGKVVSSVSQEGRKLYMPHLLVNWAFKKPIGLVDLYGSCVANRVLEDFGPARQNQKLSEQIKIIEKDSNLPLPIYTAVGAFGVGYWYAYSPWEISLEPMTVGGVGYSVPAWSFGRRFENGVSVGEEPEMSLGFNLGTFGSAFAANIATIIQETFLRDVQNRFFRWLINKVMMKWGSRRITSAQVFNFMKGVEGSPFKNQEILDLVDAGTDFNLPYPPISGLRSDRKADVIIIVDASGSLQNKGATEVIKLEKYAAKMGLKLPKMYYPDIAKKSMSIFVSETDPEAPVVVYLPFIKDQDISQELADPKFAEFKDLQNFSTKKCCSTQKGMNPVGGTYDQATATKVVNLMRFNVLKNQDAIWNAIKRKAQ